MTEQEKINADVQRQLALQDAKFNTFVEEMRDFKNEMLQQNKMRAEEIREIRQDMKNMQASLDAKIDGMGKHVRNLSVATIIGVATIAITVVYSILMH
ncbi:MAG: hypothetical protein IKO74_03660 [Selenomonadaceae bacterium]|nr:hypothetical protein [Selenomonadaceae bacterium]